MLYLYGEPEILAHLS